MKCLKFYPAQGSLDYTISTQFYQYTCNTRAYLHVHIYILTLFKLKRIGLLSLVLKYLNYGCKITIINKNRATVDYGHWTPLASYGVS